MAGVPALPEGGRKLQNYRSLGAWRVIAPLTLVLAAGSAEAGQYQCNHQPVADGRKACADGSPPVYVAGGVQPVPSRSTQPVQGGSVQPYSARAIQPYSSHPIQPYSSRPVQPDYAQPIAPQPGPGYAGGDGYGRRGGYVDRRGYDGHRGYQRGGVGGVEPLLGVWRTNVSGATWTGPSDQWGYAVQHTSPGAQAGALLIRPDHTFVWNSAYCTRNLGWVGTGDPGRPIALRCIEHGKPKLWSVGLDARHPGQMYVWDEWGVSYTGRR
jgi:hypothetical protein